MVNLSFPQTVTFRTSSRPIRYWASAEAVALTAVDAGGATAGAVWPALACGEVDAGGATAGAVWRALACGEVDAGGATAGAVWPALACGEVDAGGATAGAVWPALACGEDVLAPLSVLSKRGTAFGGDGSRFASVVTPEEEAMLLLVVLFVTISSNRDAYLDCGSSFLDGSEGFAGGTSGIAFALEDAVSDDPDLDFAFCGFFPRSF
jgi:hypothetical protein